MPFFDRFWWLQTLAAVPLLGLAASIMVYYVDTVYPGEIRYEQYFHTSDTLLLVMYPVLVGMFVVLAFVVVGLSFCGQERKRLRRLASAGNLDSMPLSRVTTDAPKAPAVTANPLVIMWRLRRVHRVGYLFLFAFLALILLGVAALVALFLWPPSRGLTSPYDPAFSPPLPVVLLQIATLLVLFIGVVRDLPKALGKCTGITATDEGISWRTPWGRRRLLRWDEARLLEVVPIGNLSLCREYILYGPDARRFVRWDDYLPAFDFGGFGINSKQEYEPDGISKEEMARRVGAMLNLVAARTGLASRTFHRDLKAKSSARQQRSGTVGARVSFCAFGLVFLGLGAGVALFPPAASDPIVNLASAAAFALVGGFFLVFALALAPLFARDPFAGTDEPRLVDLDSQAASSTQPFLQPGDAYALTSANPPFLRPIALILGLLLLAGGLPGYLGLIRWLPSSFSFFLSPGSGSPSAWADFDAFSLALAFVGCLGLPTLQIALSRRWALHEVRADVAGLHMRLGGAAAHLPWGAVATLTLRVVNGKPTAYRVTGANGMSEITWAARPARWTCAPRDARSISPTALAALTARQSGITLETIEENGVHPESAGRGR